MRILVVTLLFTPDGGPSAPLFGTLCENLALRGHEVTVITAVPHYPSGRVPREFRKGLIGRSHERGVEVIRVQVPSIDRANLKLRMLQFIAYQVGATRAAMRHDYDVLLITNPALETWLPFMVLSWTRKKPAVFSVQDIYPDVGVTLGIFRHRPVIAMIRWLEQFCLKRSKFVHIISDSFLEPIRSLGVSEAKMRLVHNWVDTDFIKPLPRDNGFARQHNLGEVFVALYAGNLGFSQGLEQLLAAAEILRNRTGIKFVMLGDGPMREQLVAQARQRKLENVSFLPLQPRALLPEVLASADISLVLLKKGVGASSLPSKCLSILASGRPIVASVDKESETWNLIQRSAAGVCVPPEDPAALAAAIGKLVDDLQLCQRLGENGRKYAMENHSPSAAAVKFEDLLLSAQAPAQ